MSSRDLYDVKQAHIQMMKANELRFSNTPESRYLYLSSAKMFAHSAKEISDQHLRESLSYFSYMAINQVQLLDEMIANSSFNENNNTSATATSSSIQLSESYQGRLCTLNSRTRINGVRKVRKAEAVDSVEAIKDMLELEQKLAEIGNPSADARFVSNTGGSSSECRHNSTLGESFLFLSAHPGLPPPTTTSAVGTVSHQTSSVRPYGKDTPLPLHRKTGWTQLMGWGGVTGGSSGNGGNGSDRGSQQPSDCLLRQSPGEGVEDRGTSLDWTAYSQIDGSETSDCSSRVTIAGVSMVTDNIVVSPMKRCDYSNASNDLVSDENASLLRRLDGAAEAQEIQRRVRKHMETFKTEYMVRFAKIRHLLQLANENKSIRERERERDRVVVNGVHTEDETIQSPATTTTTSLIVSQSPPSPSPPVSGSVSGSLKEDVSVNVSVNVVDGSSLKTELSIQDQRQGQGQGPSTKPSSSSSVVVTSVSGVSGEESRRVEQLERTVRGLLSRLDKTKAEMKVKDERIRQFEKSFSNSRPMPMPMPLLSTPSPSLTTQGSAGPRSPGITSSSSSSSVPSHRHHHHPSTTTLETALQRSAPRLAQGLGHHPSTTANTTSTSHRK
eukprot:gene2910-5711_t